MTILHRMVALGVQGRDGGALDRAWTKTLDVTVGPHSELLVPRALELEPDEPPRVEGGAA